MTTFYSQINEGGLLDCKDLDQFNLEDGYSIVPCVHKSWKTAEKRLLIIVESVDSLDIKNGSMLSGDTVDNTSSRDKYSTHNPMRSVFSNLLDKATSMLRPYGEDVAGQFAFGIANFNAKKIRQLSVQEQTNHFPKFTSRILAIIDRLKPTHILVCGDTASHQLLRVLGHPEGTPAHKRGEAAAANSQYKRGWVFDRVYKKHRFLMCPTLDIESLYNVRDTGKDEDEDDDADGGNSDKFAAGDLLFFVARNMCNILAGRMLHDLSHIVPNPVYIDTIEKFDKVMEKLWAADFIACDTETNNLSSRKNKLLMVQFAVSTKRGYCIPVMHRETPFTPEEVEYILKKLRIFLKSEKKKKLIFINGMFDLRIFRNQARMPLIPFHYIHELTAGEQLLDENMGLFGRIPFYFMGKYVKSSYQNLRAMFCSYGNDLYWRMKFSKEDRMTIAFMPPNDPAVLDYASLDVQSLYGMAEEQIKRSEMTYVKPNLASKLVKYSKYFLTHLHNQMSNTVQGISHMEESGAHVDVPYLVHLMSKKSPLIGVINDTKKELVSMPSTKKANSLILRKAGKSSQSLFGDTVDMTVFAPSKKAHQEVLFFDVLKLKVINYTKTGERSIGKEFLAAHSASSKEVSLFETITKGTKLLSTYVKGWHKKVVEGLDSALDECLRASYGFFTIVSGRLNSFDPSLQQIPSRGSLAYHIKRMFTPPPGCLAVKDDYSAHEVRVWSIISGDPKVAAAFKQGLEYRRQLIAAPIVPGGSKFLSPEEVAALEKELKMLEKKLANARK